MHCGVGDYTARLVSKLKTMSDDIEVVTVSSMDNADFVIKKWNLGAAKTIKAIAQNINPDIIHYQFPTNTNISNFFNLLLPRMLKKYNTFTTVHEYENYYSLLARLRTVLMSKKFKRVIVTTDYQKNLLAKQRVKATVIPIAHPFEDSELSKPFTYRDQGSVVGFFGFVQTHKQVDALVDAIQNMRHKNKHISLRIIGEFDPSNSYHTKIRQSLSESDKWLSGLDLRSVASELRNCDVVALPFRHGSSTKNSTVLAAMAVGLPVLGTLPLIKPLDNKVIEGCSVNNIESSLLALLNNHQRRVELGNNSKEMIEQQFTWQNVLRLHLDLYKYQK